jgi:hypothetical protein
VKSVIGFIFILVSLKSYSWQVTVTCMAHGKVKAEVEDLVLKNTDGKSRDSAEDIEVAGVAKKIMIGKKAHKEVAFKGIRSQSIKGFYYTLEATPEHKYVRSLKITGSLNDEVGKDELKTLDNKSFPITCNEVESLDCDIPEKPVKLPNDIVWAGGCDGGAWIQVIDLKGNKAHLKIYFSESGEIWKDSWFEFTENCRVKTKKILKTDLSSYDGSILHLRRINPREEPPQKCYLKPIDDLK